jgi:hypothetical protein
MAGMSTMLLMSHCRATMGGLLHVARMRRMVIIVSGSIF